MARRKPKGGVRAGDSPKTFNLNQLLEEYLQEKKVKSNLAEHTIYVHKRHIIMFFDKYKGELADTPKLNQAIAAFLDNRSNGYFNKILQSLRGFFGHLVDEGFVKINPVDSYRFRSHDHRVIIHDDATIKRLLSLPERKKKDKKKNRMVDNFVGVRDYALMVTMLDTGIRPSEILQLKPMNITSDHIVIPKDVTKTDEMRIVPITPETFTVIKKLIACHQKEWGSDTPIFCTEDGYEITTHYLQQRFREIYADKLGMEFTPYHLRHTFGLWYIQNGGDVFSLQKIMGHRKLETTRIYVNLARKDVAASHKKYTPLTRALK